MKAVAPVQTMMKRLRGRRALFRPVRYSIPVRTWRTAGTAITGIGTTIKLIAGLIAPAGHSRASCPGYDFFSRPTPLDGRGKRGIMGNRKTRGIGHGDGGGREASRRSRGKGGEGGETDSVIIEQNKNFVQFRRGETGMLPREKWLRKL